MILTVQGLPHSPWVKLRDNDLVFTFTLGDCSVCCVAEREAKALREAAERLRILADLLHRAAVGVDWQSEFDRIVGEVG